MYHFIHAVNGKMTKKTKEHFIWNVSTTFNKENMNPATSLASRFHLTLNIDIDRLPIRRHFARKTRQEVDSTEYEDVGIYESETLIFDFRLRI